MYANGWIDRYVEGNKTVVLSNGEYEVVLALTRFGNKETWLFNAWGKIEKTTGENGEVSATAVSTQANPTFSRTDLGAVVSNAKILQKKQISKFNNNIAEARIAYHGSGIELLQTPNGTIYGWSIGDEIYLTEEGMNPETPIHEYTHLWAKALRKQNSKAWKRIVKLCKQSKALWDAVVADENYSQLEGDEDAIASEVLARYSGQRGAERMDEAMQKTMQEHPTWGEEAQSKVAVSFLKKALRNFWQWVCDTLGIRYRNLDEVSDKALYDLLNESELEKKETNFDKKIAETLDKGGRNVLSLQEISELTNTLLNDIRQGNRPLVYQRVPFEALQGLLGEQQTLAELLTIVSRKSRRQHRSLERDGREVTSEEIVSRDGSNTEMLLDLVQYAKEKGIWIEDVVDTLNERYGKDNYIGHGAESEVWVDKERGVVIKAKVNNYYETMEEFLEGILLNNWLFGENQQRIIGIGIDRRSGSDGIRIIYETPYVETKNATPLTQEEKDEFMAGFGFEKQDHESIHSEKKGESSSYTNGEFTVGDLHNMNIVRDENGQIRCTDPIIRWVRGEHYREQTADEVERDAENEERLDEMFEGSDAIEMMVGSADPYDIDRIIADAREEYARKKLADFEAEKAKSDKPVGVVEQTKWYREWIAKASDRTHPILLLEESINNWRKNLGKPALRWSQKVRGYIESERARKSARLKDFIRKQDNELLSQVDKIGKEIKKQIKDKSIYGGFDRFRKDKDGKNIVVAINMEGHQNGIEVNEITSVYGRENFMDFARWTEKGLLEQGDYKKFQAWFTSLPEYNSQGESKAALEKVGAKIRQISESTKLALEEQQIRSQSQADAVRRQAGERVIGILQKAGVKTNVITETARKADNVTFEEAKKYVNEREDKLASQFLNSIGFTGVKMPVNYYLGNRDNISEDRMNYVIFNENDMKIVSNTEFMIDSEGENNNPTWKDALSSIEDISQTLSVPDSKSDSKSDSGAKVQQNSEITKLLSELSENLSGEDAYSAREFMGQLSLSLGIKSANTAESQYRTIRLGNGIEVKFRISDHYANPMNFKDKQGRVAINVGIEIKQSKGGRKESDSNVNYIGFVYYGDKVAGDAMRQKAIVDGIRHLIETGSFAEMPQVDNLNTSGAFTNEMLRKGFAESKSKTEYQIEDDLTPEEQSIRSQAQSDGTYMQAPNGQPTRLTEKQWLQVRTEAFRRWFGDSIVKDANGEPKVVYRGSRNAGSRVLRSRQE